MVIYPCKDKSAKKIMLADAEGVKKMLPVIAKETIGRFTLFFTSMPKEKQEEIIQSILTYSGFGHIQLKDAFGEDKDPADTLIQALDMGEAIIEASVFAEEIREQTNQELKPGAKGITNSFFLRCILIPAAIGGGLSILLSKFLRFICSL